jgi:hypothetical protein
VSKQEEPNLKRVITPIARLSYPHLFAKSEGMNGNEGKYQCELIFPEGTDLSELKAAANAAAKEKWGNKPPKNLKSPFRKGDEDREDKDGYEGSVFIGARSKDKPGVVVGPGRVACSDASEVYGGCFVKASVTAFAYDTNGNKGVAFALNNVWKIRDGEPFGSRRNAEEEFGDVEVDEEAFGDTSFEEAEESSLL